MALFEHRHKPPLPRAALGLHILIGGELGVVILAHPALIIINDLLDIGQIVLNFQNLINLLLVFGNNESRAAMLQHIGHFFCIGVLIKRHGDSTGGLCGEHSPVKIGAVAANHGHKITLVQAQRHIAHSQRVHFFRDL